MIWLVNEISIKNKGNFLQTVSKNFSNSICDGNIKGAVDDQFICVTKNWMKENYDSRPKECWL